MWPSEPVLIGPVGHASDVVFITVQLPSGEKQLDTLDSFGNLDLLTYKYLGVMTFLVAVFLLFLRLLLSSNSIRGDEFPIQMQMQDVYTKVLECIFYIIGAFIGQGNFSPMIGKIRTLWLPFTVGLFIFITGYFENLMHTEMVAEIQPPELHSVADLLQEGAPFSHYQPILVKAFHFFGKAKAAPKGSPLNQMYERAKSGANYGLVDMSGQNGSLLDRMDIMKKAGTFAPVTFVVENDLWETIVSCVVCRFEAGLRQRAYKSKETFSNGVLTFMLNKRMDKMMQRFADYKLRTTSETGLFMQGLKKVGAGYGVIMPTQQSELELLECDTNYKEEKQVVFHALPFRSLHKSCFLLLIGLLIASLVLLIELSKNNKWHNKRTFKTKVVVIKPAVKPEKWTYASGAIRKDPTSRFKHL